MIQKLKNKNLKEVLNYLLNDAKQKLKYFLEDVKEENEELYKKVVYALKIFKENYNVEDVTIDNKS